MREVGIEGKVVKREKGSEATCVGLIGDGTDETVDFFEVEVDMMLIGETPMILLALLAPLVCQDGSCQQGSR